MKADWKKFLVGAVIHSLLIINCTTIKIPEKERKFEPAREKKGVHLLIQKEDNQLIRGELITIKKNSLLLLESIKATEVFVDINEVKVIKIVKRKSTLIGSVTGFAIGSFSGALLAGVIISGVGESRAEFRDYLTGAILVGLPAAVLGGLIGAIVGVEKIKIEGKTEEEVKEVLNKLRSKARVYDYDLYIFKKIRERSRRELMAETVVISRSRGLKKEALLR